MTVLDAALSTPIARAVTWALVHFLWQGAAIAGVLFLLLRFGRWTAPGRYAIGVAALAAMLVAPIATVVWLAEPAAAPPPRDVVAPLAVSPTDLAAAPTTVVVPEPQPVPDAAMPIATVETRARSFVAPVVLGIWLTGVLALSARLLGGWIVVRRLTRRGTRPAAPEMLVLARRVAGRLALERVVRLLESTAVAVPVTVGWIKPVVLLPAAALSGLSPAQVEALVAHELAHIRRHDYLVNLVQSAVETLLFYHPAVWWTSRQVRIEREHCCDDLAVNVCDRLVYATALTDLAALTTPRLAIAATDGSLLARVSRILGHPSPKVRTGSGWIPAVIVATVAGLIVPVVWADGRNGNGSAFGSEVTQSSGAPEPLVATAMSDPRDGRALGEALKAPRAHLNAPNTGWQVGAFEQSQTQQTQAERARQEELRKQVAAVEQRQAVEREVTRALQEEALMLARERLALEQKLIRAKAEARLQTLEAELSLAQHNMARAKQMVETGTAGPEQLREAEAAVMRLQGQLRLEKVELDSAQMEAALRLRQLELEYKLAEARARSGGAANVEITEEPRRVTATPRLAARRVMPAAELTRAGDELAIEIANEPDLPRAYTVRTDGTIRVPFVGSIKVTGLTAAQVGQTIGEWLSDRKLGSAAGVKVTLRR
jgi:beta-lactamase regulating signal transducer with metallopeptidase domain